MLASQVYMGSVPDMPLSYVWDHSPETSQIFHDTFQARGPIQGSGRPMGLVPYMSLMHVWDQSHVLLKDYCGTGPIKYRGLQNKQIHKTSMTTLNQVVPFMVLRDPWDWSHACISGIYGTGPAHVSRVNMGPVPWELILVFEV